MIADDSDLLDCRDREPFGDRSHTTGELVARTAGGAAQTDKALAPSPANVLCLLHIFDAGKPMAIMSKIRKQGGAAVLTIPPALLK